MMTGVKTLSIHVLFLLGILTCLSGCIDPPDFDETPEITGISLSKDSMFQGVVQSDSIVFAIQFTDGDGDFGSNVVGSASNIFITDGRNKDLVYPFKAPEIPTQSSKNGVKGTIYLTMYTICCLTGQNQNCCLSQLGCPDTNVFPFEVQIADRAGNKSNIIKTNDVVLICD